MSMYLSLSLVQTGGTYPFFFVGKYRLFNILFVYKHISISCIMTEITQSVIDGLRQAEREFPIETGVIICGLRNMDPTTSIKLAELAVAFKNRGVVGFDLAGSEFNYPAKEHKEAFELSLKNNLNITIHAGEAYGPDSIHQAVHYCGAHRIDRKSVV